MIFWWQQGLCSWRGRKPAALTFDPNQQAVILCAAEKQGVPKREFYKALIAKADRRFDDELNRIKEGRERGEAKRKAVEREAGKGAKSAKKGKWK